MLAAAPRSQKWCDYRVFRPRVGPDALRDAFHHVPEVNVPITQAETILNHVSGTLSGVERTNGLYNYAKEKCQALVKWEKRFEKTMKRCGVELL